MPIYEYKCKTCGHLHEFIMKMSDPHPEECPGCGQQQSLVKQMSQAAFQLKGGGWYNEAYDGKSNRQPKEKKGEVKSKDKPSSSPAKNSTGADQKK